MNYRKWKFKKGKISSMSYKVSDYILALVLTVFFISFAVVIGVFEPFIYPFDLTRYDLANVVGLDNQTILDNYRILIEYQSIFYRGILDLPDFIMSQGGRIHFEEVKRIFDIIQVVTFGAGAAGVVGIILKFANCEYMFLKLASIFTIVIPTLLGIVVMGNFEQAFVTFHRLAFKNDYWIFDVRKDPVINILPEEFFMHKFLVIIAVIIIFALISHLVYRNFAKKIVSN